MARVVVSESVLQNLDGFEPRSIIVEIDLFEGKFELRYFFNFPSRPSWRMSGWKSSLLPVQSFSPFVILTKINIFPLPGRRSEFPEVQSYRDQRMNVV